MNTNALDETTPGAERAHAADNSLERLVHRLPTRELATAHYHALLRAGLDAAREGCTVYAYPTPVDALERRLNKS